MSLPAVAVPQQGTEASRKWATTGCAMLLGTVMSGMLGSLDFSKEPFDLLPA